MKTVLPILGLAFLAACQTADQPAPVQALTEPAAQPCRLWRGEKLAANETLRLHAVEKPIEALGGVGPSNLPSGAHYLVVPKDDENACTY